MEEISKNKIHLTRIQKLIGKLMLQSKQQRPFFYMDCRADLTELTWARKSYCKTAGVRVTTNDFFFCAIARAIQKFPLMAGRIEGDGEFLRISDKIGVGFAVSAPQGLVVPVIQDIDNKPLSQIARESETLLRKARSNKLVPDDFSGANIVLSSLGMYGVTSFYAIAPPDAAAIISIGTLDDALVKTDGDLAVRKTMSVAIAADRRIADEHYTAQFLRFIIEQLETPSTLTNHLTPQKNFSEFF